MGVRVGRQGGARQAPPASIAAAAAISPHALHPLKTPAPIPALPPPRAPSRPMRSVAASPLVMAGRRAPSSGAARKGRVR